MNIPNRFRKRKGTSAFVVPVSFAKLAISYSAFKLMN